MFIIKNLAKKLKKPLFLKFEMPKMRYKQYLWDEKKKYQERPNFVIIK